MNQRKLSLTFYLKSEIGPKSEQTVVGSGAVRQRELGGTGSHFSDKQHLIRTQNVPGPMPGPRHTNMNKTEVVPPSSLVHERVVSKQIREINRAC